MSLLKTIIEKFKQQWNDLSKVEKIIEIFVCLIMILGLVGMIIINSKGGNGTKVFYISLAIYVLFRLVKWLIGNERE